MVLGFFLVACQCINFDKIYMGMNSENKSKENQSPKLENNTSIQHFAFRHLCVFVGGEVLAFGFVFAAGFIWHTIEPAEGMEGLGHAFILYGSLFPVFATIRGALGAYYLSEGWEAILWALFEMVVLGILSATFLFLVNI
jgi:hypothetical protein